MVGIASGPPDEWTVEQEKRTTGTRRWTACKKEDGQIRGHDRWTGNDQKINKKVTRENEKEGATDIER
jgi:hypothetical protein